MEIEPLSVGEVEYIAHTLAKQWFDQEEPIPDFSTRFPDKLESCLQQPFIIFTGLDPYPTLVSKASILFYLITKNHPFLNGNKRLAVTTTLNFLAKNGKWIKATPIQLYEISKIVAKSKPNEKDAVIIALNLFIDEYLMNFNPNT